MVSRGMGTTFSLVITTFKAASLVFVLGLGIFWAAVHGSGPSFSGNIFENTSSNLGNYAIALFSGLWPFDGWDTANVCFSTPGKP